MRFLSWLLGGKVEPDDDLGNELREALATIITRAMSDSDGALWELSLYRCSIRGVPIGSWQCTVTRIADNEEEHGRTE